MKSKSESKTIRFPEQLYKQLEIEKEASGKSFSAVVIEKLENGRTISITEGKSIAKYLFEIQSLLQRKAIDEDINEQLSNAIEQFVDVIKNVCDKYVLEGGDENGNS